MSPQRAATANPPLQHAATISYPAGRIIHIAIDTAGPHTVNRYRGRLYRATRQCHPNTKCAGKKMMNNVHETKTPEYGEKSVNETRDAASRWSLPVSWGIIQPVPVAR